MLPGQATAEGTAAFASRHRADHAHDFYGPLPVRAAEGAGPDAGAPLTVSSFGLGTYLGDSAAEADAGYAEATAAAVAAGVNLIDTAINYRAQGSERMLGDALAALVRRGVAAREELVIATKAGFNPRDRDVAERGGAALLAGVPDEEVVRGHCLHPSYLERMLARSLENMQLAAVDLFYLHNPETQLPHVAKPVFYERMRRAFTVLEAARARGEVGCYGVATWDGLRSPLGEAGALDLARLVEVARSVGGEQHGFAVVQLPVSLALPEGLTAATQRVEGEPLPAIEAARRLGLAVVTSGPLAQGELVGRDLPAAARALLDPEGDATPAQRALRFARSCGGHATLVGMGRVAHVEEDLAAARRPRLPLADARAAAEAAR